MIVGFIQVRWVDLVSSMGLSGSFGFVGFIWAHPGGRFLGSFGRAMGVVVFIRARFVEFIFARPGRRSVHWSAPWCWLGSFVFVEYIR